jgi:tubulin--tyrosine ligase
MLALFAASDFEAPAALTNDENDDAAIQDLTAHLTNTCLQSTQTAKESVFLLSDLTGKPYLSPETHEAIGTLSPMQTSQIIKKIGEVVAETFKAGLGMSNHFQVLPSFALEYLEVSMLTHWLQQTAPNAFEVFGVDILLETPPEGSSDIPVYLLEVNACPDFRQTGDERHHVIEKLFEGVLEVAVKPFFESKSTTSAEKEEAWTAGEQRGKWLKCLDKEDR